MKAAPWCPAVFLGMKIMQLQGATKLELRLREVLARVSSEMPASELETSIETALADAIAEIQKLRGFWPESKYGQSDPTFERCNNGDVLVIVPGRTFRVKKDHWGSHIANMSFYGEEDYGWYRAMNFHAGSPIHESCPLKKKQPPDSWKDAK